MDYNKFSDDQLLSLIAKLESKVDFLESEVTHLNDLLLEFGFSNGVESLKNSIKDILHTDDPE